MKRPARLFACFSVGERALFCLLAGVLLLETAAALPNAVFASAGETPVPILMYHSVLKDPKRSGKYVVTPQELESDLHYLSERGYTAIFVSQLADAVLKGGELPEKPVILTFDDGYLNNLTYVLPLLEQYDMKAVVSIVGSYSETAERRADPNPTYAYLAWEDITALFDSQRIEIANHSYDMHRQSPRRGVRQMRGESDAKYYGALVSDIGKTQSLLEEYCGILPTTFTYPCGDISPVSLPILQEMGFTAMLTCYERINYVGADPRVLLSLGRFNRASGVSTEKYMKKLGIR